MFFIFAVINVCSIYSYFMQM